MIENESPLLPIRDPEPDAALTLSIYCTCGAKLVGKTNRVELADAVMKLFNRMHFGEGHAPTTPQPQQKWPKGPWRLI
jgi:hypothetical protein